jgi:hypothetical protein
VDAFRDAGLNPELNPAIIEWLRVHYVQQASASAGSVWLLVPWFPRMLGNEQDRDARRPLRP